MNFVTAVVLCILIAAVAGIIYKLVKDKKNGKSSCGCDCSACGGCCHCDEQQKNS